MPIVIDYDQVLAQADRQSMRCLYHNSGAFGFPPGVATFSLGWIGPEDASIRPAARPLVRQAAWPYSDSLASLAVTAWTEFAAGPLWLLPKSHWAYELDFGSAAWMPALLTTLGVDPNSLQPRNDAAALAFSPNDAPLFQLACQTLLEHLSGSDFAILFPNHPLLCTIHSHQQLWWTTSDAARFARLEALLPAPQPAGAGE